jgi:hypothetical protein
MKVKAWQVVLIVASVVVCAVSFAWNLSKNDGPDVHYILHYIDVETGDIFRVDIRSNNIGAPGKNPETGKMSLVRLDKKPSGEWFVSPHDKPTLHQLDAGVQNKMVDESTGELRGPAKSPVAYVRKK